MARVPRPVTKPASIWPIHRLADAAELRLAKAFLDAFREMRESLDLDLLGRAYRGNNPHIIWGPAWQIARNILTRKIQAALEVELNDAAAFALRGLVFLKAEVPARAQGAFTIINRRAVNWAAREAAELVQQVDAETREAIKALIVQMQRGNLTYQQAARELRQIVGLTTQQAQAVMNFRRKLEARAGLLDLVEGERTALTPAQRALIGTRLTDTQARIDALVDRYEARMLRFRTETIARTESMTAANRGQQEAWKAARDMGLLTQPVQRWLVTPDRPRLCDLCAPMEGQTAPLGQPFTNPQTMQQYEGPPIHPNCRCSLSLVISEEFTESDRELAADIQVTVLPPS